MNPAPELVRVRTVYGETRIIARADLDNPARTQLPIYTSAGRPKNHHNGAMGWSKAALPTTLHRGNIAEVLP